MIPDSMILNPSSRVELVKEQMNNFLGLLKKSISDPRDNILIETNSQYDNSQYSQQSKKLSIILSASEGASSEHHERKYMNEFGSSSLEENFIRPLIVKKTSEIFEESIPSTTGKLNDFDQSGLFHKGCKSQKFLKQCSRVLEKKNQQQLLEYIKSMVKDYNNYIEVLQNRNNENLLKKEKYRTKCEHLFRVFVTGREEQKRYQQTYIQHKNKIQKLQQMKGDVQLKLLKACKQLQISKSQNIYLKQLIIIANKNYENLQKKYQELQQKFKSSEMVMKQKQIHFIQGNSVLKDVILNLQKDRKIKSRQKSKQKEKQSRQKYQRVAQKQNQENRHINKHKTSKSVSPQSKVVVEQYSQRKDEITVAYRRMFLKTLRGG